MPYIDTKSFESGAPNTRIDYMYRDGDNYKQHDSVYLKGAVTLEQAQALVASLLDGVNFIPEQVGFKPMEWSLSGGDSDHPYHEITEIALSTISPDDSRAVADVVAEFVAIGPQGWTPVEEPKLCLWFIGDEVTMGDNSDLFVNAVDQAEAVKGWRTYYDLDADATPERVIRVPTTLAPGPVAWETIEQHVSR